MSDTGQPSTTEAGATRAGNPMARNPMARADLAVAIGVVAIGVIAGWQASVIPANALYATIGPAVFAWAAAAMLVVMGLLLVKDALRGGWSSAEDFGEVDELGGVWMILGLVINLAIIDTMGFIVASTLLFICTARAFGSRQSARDAGIGFTLAVAAYIGFDRVLGYKIGSGVIERLL
jgi:putative tricarboxylic transport membrane protein